MQRRDSLGVTTKIPRLSTGTTRKLKTRRSRSTISSVSDVFTDEATTRGQAGLSVSGMKLRSEKNLNDDEGGSGEARPASETPRDPFEEGEQTLTRPDYHHHADLKEPDEEFGREEVERTGEASERSEVEAREELLLKERPNRTLRVQVEKGTILSSQTGQECDDVEHKPEGGATKFKSEKKLQDDVR